MTDYTQRPATAADAAAVAGVYLASRRAFLPYAPLAHPDDAVRRWVADLLIPGGGVQVVTHGDAVVAMLALSDAGDARWIDQLYVAPEHVGRGIGTRCVQYAQRALAPPVRLYTFQANTGARRLYERHGFRAVAFGDGSTNEERCPDVLYAWAGASAL
jgi:ribosomal protein S18 acetylase RimI-like enzyme